MPRVDVHIVTYNSAECIDECLASVIRQRFQDFQITVFDNGSQDNTSDRLLAWESRNVRVVMNGSNLYYSRAHNLAIRESSAEYVLVLNPDVILDASFLAHAVAAMDRIQKVGSVNGLLIRVKPGDLGVEIAKTPHHTSILLDGAGLMMHKSRRPDLRGNNQPAKPPYLKPSYIFGADAACALYRRSMLEDVAVGGEYFDEDFKIYREDVDLAWRAQLLGWDCLYLPSALAYHVRSFRPGQNRRSISTVLKRHSVKNGWLLVVKNDSAGALLKNLVWVLSYQLKILSGLVFVEPSSLAAIPSTVRLLPKILHKRTEIKKRRVRSEADMRKWFV